MATIIQERKVLILQSFLEMGNSLKWGGDLYITALEYLGIKEEFKVTITDSVGNDRTDFIQLDQLWNRAWQLDQDLKEYTRKHFDNVLQPKNKEYASTNEQ